MNEPTSRDPSDLRRASDAQSTAIAPAPSRAPRESPANDRFLRACRLERVDATPVWFMRQAGRYMPEYRALREKYTMLDLCRTPELATQVTLQPLQLGVDAAILFADILLPLDPMGVSFDFDKDHGPRIARPVRQMSDIDRLRVIHPEESLQYVLQTIRLVQRELTVPLIGFAGAPFTLASYLIEGGRSSQYATTKRLMLSEPIAWNSLMSKLSEVVLRFLRAQVEAGAQALQIFDSWVGQLGPEDYCQFVKPYMQTIFAGLMSLDVPVIHFGTGTATLLEEMVVPGVSVLGLDWRVGLRNAWDRIGRHIAVQGNLDPAIMLAPRGVIHDRALRVLTQSSGKRGHIFNVGHGLLPETPPAEVHALVDFIHLNSRTCQSGSEDD